VSIDRRSFERAIKALGKIDAIALIRDAYSCNIQEAKELLEILRKRE
jgi:ribosomal protein L7/L12